MPRDLAGNYALPLGNPVVTDTVIESVWANTTMSDIATQLNGVVTQDGKLKPTAQFQVLPGAVGAPGLAFNGDSTTGFYQTSAGRLSFAVSGVNVGTVTPTSFTFTTTAFPAVGADPVSGNQLTRKSYVDTAVATGGGAYVPLAGGTMTGNLTITKAAPELILNTTDVTSQSTGILVQNTGVLRWRHLLQGLETGGNAGSFFSFRAYTDAGALIGPVLNLYRDLSALFSGVVTATGGFIGNLIGNVTGNLTGNVTGNLTGTVTGSLVGNASGSAATLSPGRNLNGTLFTGSANITVPTNVASDSTNAAQYVVFAVSSGNVQSRINNDLTFNPSTGAVTATGVVTATGGFVGNLVGNASGSAATLSPGRNINGTLFNGSSNITILTNFASDATNANQPVTFSAGSGTTQARQNTNLTYNPSTNVLNNNGEIIAASNIPTDDFSVGFRKVLRSSSVTMSRLYVGFCKSLSAGITIPSGTFEAGDAMSFYNNSGSAWNLTRGAGLTMYNSAGVNSATISVPAHTRVTVWFDNDSECSVA